MKEKKHLKKEISNNNMKGYGDENKNAHENSQKKLIQKKGQNNKEKIDEETLIPEDELELEHPTPLRSDYNEELKEEIFNNFYQNQLKEKDKYLKNREKKEGNYKIYSFDNNNPKIYLNIAEKKEKPKFMKNSPKNSFLHNEEHKFDNNSNLLKIISDFKDNNTNIVIDRKNIQQEKNNLFQKDKILKLGQSSETLIMEKGGNLNKNKEKKIDIIKGKYSLELNNRKKLIILENNYEQQKNKTIIQNGKKNQLNRELNQVDKLKKMPQKNKLNSNNKSEKIIKFPLKIKKELGCSSNKDIKEKGIYTKLPSKKIIKKIKQSFKNQQNIIYINKENDNNINIHYNIKNMSQNKSQIFLNNYNNINQNKGKQHNQMDNIIIKNELGKKSQSFGVLPLCKIYNNNSYQLNNNFNIKKNNFSKSDMFYNDKAIKTEQNANNFSPTIQNQHSGNTSNDNIDSYFNIKKIPMIFNYQKSKNNSQIFTKIQKNTSKNKKFNYIFKNYNSLNFNKRKIYNNGKNSFLNENIDQKENIQNNSQYKNNIYKIGGQFNNIQTTFINYSKNANSSIKLIPKNIKTINYESNKFLNSIQSKNHLYSPKLNQQKQILPYSNDEQNIYHNFDDPCQHFSLYSENQNQYYIPKIQNKRKKIGMFKNQNILHIKNNLSFYNNQILNKNNCGINYMNYMKYSNNSNEAHAIINHNLRNNQINYHFNTMDNYENSNNYEGSNSNVCY